MDQFVFISNKEDLKETLREVLREERTKEPELNLTIKLDRREAAKFLGVSYQTMFNWTKSGVLTEHGLGRKKFYLKQELIDAMKNEKGLERS